MASMETTMSITSDPVATEFETRFQQPPAAKVDEKELARWKELCRAAIEERDRLRTELTEVTKERDCYRKSLIAELAKEDIPFTKEEIMACRGQHPTMDELIEELRRGDQ